MCLPSSALKQIALQLVSLFAIGFLPAARLAQAQTLTTLYSFADSARDGANPAAGLIVDANGNFYGTTEEGGRANLGTVFKLDPNGVESVLHQFNVTVSVQKTGGGIYPVASLVQDGQGNLYGTTNGGPCSGCSTVFRVTPSGAEKTLHHFAGSPDGAEPEAGLIIDAQGNLYGTTGGGGFQAGTAFRLAPDGTETVLYRFDETRGDGVFPNSALVVDAQGNFYGTTFGGGAFNAGAVFKLTPNGTETLVYSFSDAPDGKNPIGVILDAQGSLYGATQYGGTFGSGTVFKLTPDGVETVLHSFAGYPTDGAVPQSGLLIDTQQNLYGVTIFGGANNCFGDGFGCGTVFKVTSNGTETLLHSFCPQSGCTDGFWPNGGLIADTIGNLYGTTFYGGDETCEAPRGCGVVFKLKP